jgi:hypothetical protein
MSDARNRLLEAISRGQEAGRSSRKDGDARERAKMKERKAPAGGQKTGGRHEAERPGNRPEKNQGG